MKIRLFAVVMALVAAPFAFSADEENPYKKTKIGDFATYKMTSKVAGQNVEGTVTQTVTAKDDKEVTLKSSGKVTAMGMEIPVPEQEQKIDLTKPFDPTKASAPAGAQVDVTKLKDGTEKIKAGGKEYATNWTTYKVKMKVMGMDVESEMKVWQTKDLNFPVVKMEMTSEIAGQKMEVGMELLETGTKEPEKKKEEEKKKDK
jgi:hypothetical protein